MDPSFIPVEVVPSKTPFGLDQLRRSYKTALSAEVAIAAAPAVRTADETFPNMFLMPISTPESAERATRVDLVYMGCLAGAEGSPVLPDQKTDQSTAVQSASSSRLSTGATLTSPATLQYYAPASELTYFSFGAPGTIQAPMPSGSLIPITLTIGDITYTPGSVQSSIDLLFVTQVISTIDSTEIVPGQYWQNVARTSLIYSPWIYSPPASGPYISLFTPGTFYTVGDTVTIAVGGESAVMTVTAVGVSDSILAFTVGFNNFTAPHSALPGSGGGIGAKFNVTIIP